MSSIWTAEPPGDPSRPNRPPDLPWTAARSASLSAMQTHSTSRPATTEESPVTTPPPPRLADRSPFSPNVNDTGPRLFAISSRPALDPAPISNRFICRVTCVLQRCPLDHRGRGGVQYQTPRRICQRRSQESGHASWRLELDATTRAESVCSFLLRAL